MSTGLSVDPVEAPVKVPSDDGYPEFDADAGLRPSGYREEPQRPPTYRRVLTGFFAAAPVLAAIFLLVNGIGGPVPWFDIALLVFFAALVGHGVTIGYHRLFTHKSFVANRPLKIVLASLGSMSFQGSLIGWVADHRRHHRFADRPARSALADLEGRRAAHGRGRPVARAPRLVLHQRGNVTRALRVRPARRPGSRAHRQAVPSVLRTHAAPAVRDRVRVERDDGRRSCRAAVGRAAAGGDHAQLHVVHQLGVSHASASARTGPRT